MSLTDRNPRSDLKAAGGRRVGTTPGLHGDAHAGAETTDGRLSASNPRSSLSDDTNGPVGGRTLKNPKYAEDWAKWRALTDEQRRQWHIELWRRRRYR